MATVITTYDELKTACSTSGSYELGNDIVANTKISVTKTVTLDLKNYTITFTNKFGFGVEGEFTINGGDDGAIIGTKSTSSTESGAHGISVGSRGKLTLNGGTITGWGSTNSYNNKGGGIAIVNGGRFTMNGGTISDNSAAEGAGVLTSGTFLMYGGSITGNTALRAGGGVMVGAYQKPGGRFTMYGGSITGNTASYASAVDVYAYPDDNSFLMRGGIISGNLPSNKESVYVEGKFQIGNGAQILDYGVNLHPTAADASIWSAILPPTKIFVNTPSELGDVVFKNPSNYTVAENCILSSDGQFTGVKSGTNVVWAEYIPPVPKIPVKVGDSWKDAIAKVKVGGSWKDVVEIKVKVNDEWKKVA